MCNVYTIMVVILHRPTMQIGDFDATMKTNKKSAKPVQGVNG